MLLTNGNVDCSPEEVGFDSSRIDALNKHFQRLIDAKSIQCASYCISRYGKVIAHAAIGPLTYHEGDTTPLLPTTIFPIASVTKTFTATAIMKLIEDGYARLDTPVGDILPAFAVPPFNKINIFHLLSHTSGLYPDPGCFDNRYSVSAWEFIDVKYKMAVERGEEKDFDWIAASLSCGLRKEPGTEWQYCSFGFCILGAIIEKLSGRFAHDYIEDEIVKPLGMMDTGFKWTVESVKRAIVPNERRETHMKKFLENPDALSDDAKIWEKIPNTGGGLHSTPYDIIRYANMFLGHGRLGDVRILGRKTVEKMTTRTLKNIPDFCWTANEPDRGYGAGFDMRSGLAFHYSPGTFMHEGAGGCSMNIDPVEQLAMCWFVPFVDDKWDSQALYNANNIICSGLI